MLKELYIENLAVIKQATITFNNNLNIFTGETGAGKSILINGINAVLGQRTSKEIVRTGCEKAVIVALFVNLSQTTKNKLTELNTAFEDDEIIITREIFSDGGSVARINSRTITVSSLREIGETLINIHGQHDNQILLSPEKHINIIDNFGDIHNHLTQYQLSFKNLQETARKINKISVDEREKVHRIFELNEIINEIESLDISENEDITIEEEYNLSKNSARIFEAVNNAYEFLIGTDDSTGAIVLADNAAEEMLPLSDLLGDLEPISNRLKSASIEIDDISSELSHLLSRLDLDPKHFEFITKRREDLNKIKRKYGAELSDVFKKLSDCVSELDVLEDNDSQIEILKNQKQEQLGDVTKKAKILCQKREEASVNFIKQVTSELAFLDMPNVKLEVLHDKGKLTINGMDTIELLISANVGEPPKPIAKIASGGELSRIMLALKNVLADKDDIPTLIFDEIDTGVSGRAAQKIGIKLAQISKFRQVLCVTHLAQIAIMADNHLCIEKNVVENSTITNVKTLNFDERKHEIARIMGGDNVTDLLLKNAEELINSSKSLV